MSMHEIQQSVPTHIGIIMDGNGRWATQRGMRRSQGHREGVQAVKRVILEAIALGVDHLTVYAFSTENWLREKEEVSFLMKLLARRLRSEYAFYRQNNVRVVHIGDMTGLPAEVQREIQRVVHETRDNDAITLNLAVNYGGRDEIIRAVNRWLRESQSVAASHGPAKAGAPRGEAATEPAPVGHDSGAGDSGVGTPGSGSSLSLEELRPYLDLADTPDPDLIIRTAGERRLSNFLLWESAYAELYFSDALWPDWTGSDLREAVDDFRRRKRNYGRTPHAATSSADDGTDDHREEREPVHRRAASA
jgi:undecaprenyl diphosphate synthase